MIINKNSKHKQSEAEGVAANLHFENVLMIIYSHKQIDRQIYNRNYG